MPLLLHFVKLTNNENGLLVKFNFVGTFPPAMSAAGPISFSTRHFGTTVQLLKKGAEKGTLSLVEFKHFEWIL
jgi:hypothetical protein